MMPNFLKNKGFTLLETLIAMFIFLIIMLFLYFTFNSTQKARMETLRTGRPYLEAVYIFNVMHKKVSELNYVYPYFLGGGKKNRPYLYFNGLSHNPSVFFSPSSIENINYFYTKKAGGFYELIYKETYYKSKLNSLSTVNKKVILAKNLTYFRIRYFYNGLWVKKFNYALYNSMPFAVWLKFGIPAGGGKNKKNIENFDFKFNLHSQ